MPTCADIATFLHVNHPNHDLDTPNHPMHDLRSGVSQLVLQQHHLIPTQLCLFSRHCVQLLQLPHKPIHLGSCVVHKRALQEAVVLLACHLDAGTPQEQLTSIPLMSPTATRGRSGNTLPHSRWGTQKRVRAVQKQLLGLVLQLQPLQSGT